ncbi:putative glycoside hydrolase [Patescibacteria group bacterium]|nr:putative glycoside hydrolase [Patescibacteria group bacterium]
MKKLLGVFIIITGIFGLYLFTNIENKYNFSGINETATIKEIVENIEIQDPNADLPFQKKLENPPQIIKAIYSTGWSAGSIKKRSYLINLIKSTELNAIVIDIKNCDGELSYGIDIDLAKKYGSAQIKILKPNAIIKELHDAGIYVIARIAVFQDKALANARPDLALQSKSKNTVWKDYRGLSWVDQTSKEVWDYNIAVAQDASDRGFDEINFDYIRFASDGNMSDIKYPFYDEIIPKMKVIDSFFKYLRENLPNEKISADLFGYTTLLEDDLGIGQNLETAFSYFDYVAPMVYPSHYNKGFNGYTNPAEYPYDVVYLSMLKANERLVKFNESTTTLKMVESKLRPWLQDFDLGAEYDSQKVRAQIQATYDAASTTQTGWMLWAASNIYTKEALE